MRSLLSVPNFSHPAPLVPSTKPLAAEFLTEFSENLKLPAEISSANGELRTTLSVIPAVARAGPLTPALNVRAYNGSVPGPTLRIKPGDRLVVNLVNMLGEPEGDPMPDGGAGAGTTQPSFVGRVVGWPNVTNLHVHGLHVSPKGIADNIYRCVWYAILCKCEALGMMNRCVILS